MDDPRAIFARAEQAEHLHDENDALRALVQRLEEKLAEAYMERDSLREALVRRIEQDAALREYETNIRVLEQAERRRGLID